MFGMEIAALKHACAVADRCGNSTQVCARVDTLPQQAVPTCPAAATCLHRIDRLSCTQDNPDELLDTLARIPACQDALGC